jgi:excinuclease ABC subunit B
VRRGEFDVLIGINLLREGLDLPEVSLVAILDADKEGFLRAARSLIQTIGRAARNVNGLVIMYADTITGSMKTAIRETDRRRDKQRAYNVEHGITPRTIEKRIQDLRALAGFRSEFADGEDPVGQGGVVSLEEVEKRVVLLRAAMKARAKSLEFESAAKLRDRVGTLESFLLGMPLAPGALEAALAGEEDGAERSAGRGGRGRRGPRARGRGGRKRP